MRRSELADQGDEHVVDCAMNGRAVVVTSNIRDFTWAQAGLRLQVLSPGELLRHLTEHGPVSSGQDQE